MSINKKLINIALSGVIVFGISGCVKKEKHTEIPHETGDSTEVLNEDDLVFYDLGPSAKSIQEQQPPPEADASKSPYVECETDTDCAIKNKHVFNPLDPENTGLSQGELHHLEKAPQPKQLNDNIYDLIDELGAIDQSLKEHGKQATSTKSDISKKIEKKEEKELLDEIEKEIQKIEASTSTLSNN